MRRLVASRSVESFAMKKPAKVHVDPAKIFLQAHRFNQAYKMLMPVEGPVQYGPGDEVLAQPAAVVSAFACELFFKCLIRIETGTVPHGHHLKHFYDRLTPPTRNRVTDLWNTLVVPIRRQQASMLHPNDRPPNDLLADLKAALIAGNAAFEKIRYSYEGDLEDFAYVLSDLAPVLGHVCVELKPELAALRPPLNQKQPTSPTR